MRMELRKIGPDGISSRLLDLCRPTVQHIVVLVWSGPEGEDGATAVEDILSGACTSHLIKTFERLVLTHLQYVLW